MIHSSLESWVSDLQGQNEAMKNKGMQKLLQLARSAYTKKDFNTALDTATLAKKLRTPHEGIDQLRALCFLRLDKYHDAVEAYKEELRWFPHNAAALEDLTLLQSQMDSIQPTTEDAEFLKLFKEISPYTMVGTLRLQSLFSYAKQICESGLEGNFVECGVAGGGSSGLLAWVLAQYAKDEKKLFCCDSFSGMPESDEYDTHQGIQAETTHWGAGTCSAPESSVQNLCEKLGVAQNIIIVKGFFNETLPVHKEHMGKIAFLHMDGDWYSSTKDILENLYDNLVPGAYVQIDDYSHWEGCRKALHEFAEKRGLQFTLRLIDSAGACFFKP